MITRSFDIGDVLTVTTGILLSPMEDVYAILNFMTGDNLYTHQLPRASDECRPFLLQQFPALAALDTTCVDGSNWKAWLDEQVAKFGRTLQVAKLPPHAHEQIDPLSELAEKIHPSKIIVIER